MKTTNEHDSVIDNRPSMDVDIVCVGFGPAMGGFLTELSKNLAKIPPESPLESKAMPGAPLQVLCYERADDLSFGVSGVVTKGRSIYESFPCIDIAQIPTAARISEERLVYLLDPLKVSRRGLFLKITDRLLKFLSPLLPKKIFSHFAFTLPFVPPFMKKDGGFVISLGQFMQWVSQEIMSSGLIQVWPASPVASPLINSLGKIEGIRLVDQGTKSDGTPDAGYTPGMDVKAFLTIIGDGPIGAVGQELDRKLGVPKDFSKKEWAVGVKAVIELKSDVDIAPGTVIHTFGFPEPEIFGFMYVLPDHKASVGVFVPSWFLNPLPTGYRYLQHWMMHPYLWQYLEGGTLVSFGAKSLQESGKRGEPYLAGDGFARIGEGSGSTNILSGSGVDEAWATGVLLGRAVIEILKKKLPFSKEILEKTYVEKRRLHWVDKKARIAKRSRDGFHWGFVSGLIGMTLSGFSRGTLNFPQILLRIKHHKKTKPSLEGYVKNKISSAELQRISDYCKHNKSSLHDEVMNHLGWPEIPYDGKLLISHQDALLLGGKVQAPTSGFHDHVKFEDRKVCQTCTLKKCIEICSGQAIKPDDHGLPHFEREKCLHCGACYWSCVHDRGSLDTNITFKAGPGGLHSSIN